MISTHWQLPAAPLRASAVATVVAGFAGAIAIAELARGVLPVGGIYAVKAGAIFSIVMIVALGFLPRHHPFARFGPANQITTMRAMLVALVAALIGEPRFPNVATSAAAATVVVSALDGVDGWLARRHQIASSFGARFDMEIDALLILVLAILVTEFEKAGAVGDCLGAVALHLRRRRQVLAAAARATVREPPPPGRLRRANPRAESGHRARHPAAAQRRDGGGGACRARLVVPRRYPLAAAERRLIVERTVFARR